MEFAAPPFFRESYFMSYKLNVYGTNVTIDQNKNTFTRLFNYRFFVLIRSNCFNLSNDMLFFKLASKKTQV